MHIPALRPNHEKTSSRSLPAAPRGQECLCDRRGIALTEQVFREVSHSYEPQETKGRTLPAASKLHFKVPRKDFCPTKKHCSSDAPSPAPGTFLQPLSLKRAFCEPRLVQDPSILNLLSAGACSSLLILSGSTGKVFAIWAH